MLTRSFLSPVLCSALLTLAACDKEESLGEVESETAAESESDSASDSASESDSGSSDTQDESDSGTACPADAMICPDGTAVGRSGPDCAFDPCPGETDSGTEGDPPPNLCPPDVGYFEPAACPSDGDGTPYIIEPGCYASCDPGSFGEGECGEAEVCMTLEVNPCICDDGDVCCGACSAGGALCVPVATGEACENAFGTYLSLEEFECGLSPDGIEMCQWQISLDDDGGYLWMYSDVGEGGNFACIGGVITLDNNPSHSATLDADGVLTWDGIEYAQVEF